MSDIEELVGEFFARREAEPDLSATGFAAGHGDDAAELVRAIRAALVVETELGGAAAAAPVTIGPYRVVRPIGSGGMGAVFEVERDGRRFALKALGSSFDDRARARFAREASALARLDHRGIVDLVAFDAEASPPYLVMPLLDGEDIAASCGRVTVGRAVELVAEVAEAVAAAHAVGVLHRDLKPGNVRVLPDGHAVVLDFGLAVASDEPTLTGSGDLLGTPRYMAPEQARGERCDERADVYALGLLLYELVLGEPMRAASERSAVMAAAAAGRTRRLGRLRARDRGVGAVVGCAIAREPRRRYAGAAELCADLRRLAAGERPLGRPPGVAARVADSCRRHPRRAASAAVAGAAGLVLAILLGVAAVRAADRQRALAAVERGLLVEWSDGRDVAEAEYAHARRLCPDDPVVVAVSADAPPGDALGRAVQAARGRDVEAAAVAARQARADGCEPFATALFARAADASGDRQLLGEAEAALFELATAREDSVLAWGAFARVAAHCGDHDGAERALRSALALADDLPSLWFALAQARLKDDPDECERALARAVELRGDEPADYKNLRGALLDRRGRHADAELVLQTLVTEHPDRAAYLFNLAYCLDAQLRVAEAAPLYVRAIDAAGGGETRLRAELCLAWLLATAADESVRDVDAAVVRLRDAWWRDRGRSESLHRVTEAIARTAAAAARIVTLLDEVAAAVDTPAVAAERMRALAASLRNTALGR